MSALEDGVYNGGGGDECDRSGGGDGKDCVDECGSLSMVGVIVDYTHRFHEQLS